MNRKERKARGVKGKQGDETIIHNAVALARQLKEKRQMAEALKLYEKILQYDPDNAIALFDLALEDISAGRSELADAKFSKILTKESKHIGALIGLAGIRLDQGRRDEALALVEKAQRQKIPHGGLIQLSVFYRNAGMLDRAKDALYGALKLQPDDIGAWYVLQDLTKYRPEDVEVLNRLEKQADIPLTQKITLGFATGKAHMDTGQPDLAFWHFAQANLLKRATYKYNPDFAEAYVESIIKLFNEETIARLRNKSSIKSNKPIFVVGMPRSGSTLVDQILSSHPDVGSVGEARFLGQSLPVYPNEEVPHFIPKHLPSVTRKFVDDLDGVMLETIGEKYLSIIGSHSPAPRVVDKMLFNFLWVGLIRLALPEAKVVHCMRDPVDIGLSIWQILFGDDIPWAYDQTEIARYYRGYEKIMAHWRKVFPGEVYDVRYEDVVADQEGQSRKLLEFCDLPWDERVMKFHESKRTVKTASVTQVRKPIYKDSVKKWKKYEKHLRPMIDALGITE